MKKNKKYIQPFHAFTIKHKAKVSRIVTDVILTKGSDKLSFTQDNHLQTKALWDTGATKSVITKATAESLGLIAVGTANVNHAGGSNTSNTYVVNFYLINNVVAQGVFVTECHNIPGDVGALIGMDIICSGDFSITNLKNETWMTFRIPSYKGVDYVEEEHRIHFAGVKSYHPCPCGKQVNGKPVIFAQCCGNRTF